MAETKRRILYVITKSNWGGAQRYVFDLATHLPHERFEAAVVCGGNGLLAEKLRQSGIRVIAVPNLKRDIKLLNEVRALFWLFKTFARERPDVIHLNSSKIGGLGAVAGFICKFLPSFRYLPRSQTTRKYHCEDRERSVMGRSNPISETQKRLLRFARNDKTGISGEFLLRDPPSPRIIFTVHGWAFNEDRPQWQKKLIALASRLTALLQDRVIVINSADWHAAKVFVPESKLKLIAHGLHRESSLNREETRREISAKMGLAIKPEEMFVGTVAEITKNKGLEYLIESLDILKRNGRPTRTLIIGDGEDKENLQHKAHALGLKESVRFAGFIPEAQRLLAAFDIFVLPSVKEGLPYAIMEAMAAGLPVVAANVGGIPDLIEHGKNGFLVAPKNPELLAAAIDKLIADPSLRDQFGQEAQIKISKLFGLERMIFETIEVYS